MAIALVAGYIIHGAVHVLRGEPYDLLWGCHIAALLVATGLLLRNATLNAIGLLWACFGLPLWILDAATGGELMPTAALTHIGALAAGIYGVRVLGMPRGAAWKALGAYLALFVVTRVATPPRANINLAFAVQSGWELHFGNYPAYVAMLAAIAAIVFAGGELLFRRWSASS